MFLGRKMELVHKDFIMHLHLNKGGEKNEDE